MKYDKSQNLDTWTEMFSSIYESTANESKSRYEILTHLSEVTLAFGKLFFKKRDLIESKKFLTKIFSWTIALIVKVKIQKKV